MPTGYQLVKNSRILLNRIFISTLTTVRLVRMHYQVYPLDTFPFYFLKLNVIIVTVVVVVVLCS